MIKANTKEAVIKDFKAVKFMRDVRDKISIDIKDMSLEEIKKYFEERRALKVPAKKDALRKTLRTIAGNPR